ncbi:patatin-like phospholipase family protein [Nitrospirillum amazonense]|uniref:NTE family protein n=1 Tax=Nitrospirillum amazonense TaxID=28077 RepID=A0A560K453_9PROT|nr:patatin-like phospholipase family protein [Nitrospirillum amazonense]MDG3440253.1 patatin-like phospholipase family protein [Nitrospirillum amazonense]TWB75410.1 NTE family protein [Nitrospirillum amazonense]
MPDSTPPQNPPGSNEAAAPKAKGRNGQPHKRVNLGLQGGGSHGAFTWGVLDRLLEDGRLEVEAISGTSAGAMNAVVMADGYGKDGREGARQALRTFWTKVGEAGRGSPLQRSLLSRLRGSWRVDDSPGYAWFNIMNMLVSPYQSNPLGINPLRRILEDLIDFDQVRFAAGIDLYLSATNVETGKVKIFRNRDITVDAVLASACLPQMFQAVEIKGEYYWDGGFMGNPSLWPIAYENESHDIIVVQINPLVRKGVPKTPFEIADRVNEITFNASLMREMRSIRFVSRLIDSGDLTSDQYKALRMHVIENDEALADMHASSKLNAEPEFLQYLFTKGRETADCWLAANFDKVGVETSVDIVQDYL